MEALTAYEGRTLYTRHTDNSQPITISGGEFVLETGERFNTFRGLLRKVGSSRTSMSMQRYFGLDLARPEPEVELLDLFGSLPGSGFSILHKRGIDLNARGHEVQKLLVACFPGYLSELTSLGWTHEDILQEVYKGILIRNAGSGAFDERRSKFGSYVCLVCSSVLYNLKTRARRLKSREDIGLVELTGDGRGRVDVAAASRSSLIADISPRMAAGMEEAVADLYDCMAYSGDAGSTHAVLASKILPLVVEGYTRKEIALKLEIKPHRVSKALKHLREQARVWKSDAF